MSSEQAKRDVSEDPTGIGKGPEYAYPKYAEEKEPAVVVDAPAPGEGEGETKEDKEPEMSDREIAQEERLESQQAGEWREDMAQNVPQPDEAVTRMPEEEERLPSDRG